MLYSPHFRKSHFQLVHKNEEIIYFSCIFIISSQLYCITISKGYLQWKKYKKKNEIQI